jgi:hypothetical protein
MRCSQLPQAHVGNYGVNANRVLEAPRFGMPYIVDKSGAGAPDVPLAAAAFATMLAPYVRNGEPLARVAVLVSMPVGNWFREALSTLMTGGDLYLVPWSTVAILGPNTAPRKKDASGTVSGDGAIRDASGKIVGTTGFVAYHMPNTVV